MLKLIIEDDEGRKTVVPFVREEITIGRQEGNTIRLTERNVSRRHARLLRQNGSVLVEDLGSYNGIKLNGERIQGQVSVQSGDLIQIGDYDLAIKQEGAQALPPPMPTDRNNDTPTPGDLGLAPLPPPLSESGVTAEAEAEVDAELEGELQPDSDVEEASPTDVHATAAEDFEVKRRQSTSLIRIGTGAPVRPRQILEVEASQAPRLVVLNSEFAGREFACIRTQLKIGRAEDNDIALDHKSLSRTHAILCREESGEWRVLDMDSANGLQVNGEPYAQATLAPGDVIELGHLKLKFVPPGAVFEFVPGDELDKPPASRKRKLGVTLVLASVVVGGIVYFKGPRPEPEAPPAPPARAPVAVTAPVAPHTAPRTEVAPPPPPVAAVATLDQKIASARADVDKGNWDHAAETLASCKLSSGMLDPEADLLTRQLQAEAGNKRALDQAEQFLTAGKLEGVPALLAQTERTQLLRSRRGGLQLRLKEALETRGPVKAPAGNAAVAPAPVAKKIVEPPAKAAAADPLKTAPKAAAADPSKASASASGREAKRLYDEGLVLVRSKQFREARTHLEKCLKVDPTFAHCHIALGYTNGQLGDPERGVAHYRKFLQLQPNDKDADRVRNIVEQFEQSKR